MAPAAIFLDEPTSGLDATAALEVCATLKAVANLGLTVVAVVHQPRAEIFRSFDDLLLLAPGGKTVYTGAQEGAMRYFAGAGFAFGRDGNPADDLLDFIAGRDDLLVAPADLVAAHAASESAERAERASAIAEFAAQRSRGAAAIRIFEHLQARSQSETLEHVGAGAESAAATAIAQAVAAEAAAAATMSAAAAPEGFSARGAGAGPGVGAPAPGSLPLSPSSVALSEAAAEAQAQGFGSGANPVRLHGAEVATYLAARWCLHTQRLAQSAAVAAAAGGGSTASSLGPAGGGGGFSGAGGRPYAGSEPSSDAEGGGGGAGGIFVLADPLPPSRHAPSPTQPLPLPAPAPIVDMQTLVASANRALAHANQRMEALGRHVVEDANRTLASLKEGQLPESWVWAAGARGAAAGSPLAAMMADRGASAWDQFRLCHARALLQQSRQPAWLVLELAVCVAAGFIMGLAAFAVDELYSGILRPPYTFLSPAPMETMLPSLGLYINIAIGVAGSPAAVRTFGEERDMFLREHAGGHSTLAYFAAKNVSVLYRLSLAALHFAGTFAMLAKVRARASASVRSRERANLSLASSPNRRLPAPRFSPRRSQPRASAPPS